MSPLNELANAIRMLSVDAVEKAQSGHPGMPLGMADIATVLWQKFMKHNPQNPLWFNRDRFILSNGHGSMLLYSLLHLTGYALDIEELKRFRQLNSKTPGHPEHADTPGVETTTGPLAQGLGSALGMAIAEKILGQQFNRYDLTLVDHFTYAFVGDGCLMEGLSHEICSLAGTLGLGKLLVFYDDNGISIDGKVSSWFKDDTVLRFKAYNWQVLGPIDGHNHQEIEAAIVAARAEDAKPSLIICKTEIGFASPVAGSEKSHGAPLGAAGVAYVRNKLSWPHAAFEIPENIYREWSHLEQGCQDETLWLENCQIYKKNYPQDYEAFLRRINGDLPDNWDSYSAEVIRSCLQENKAMATRKSSQYCIERFAKLLPELLGGSADLTQSNNTDWSGTKPINAQEFSGNYLYYGVREFGMAAIMNGLALHGGFIPYGGTFLVFADYARPALRLSALMKQRVIYVFTHDSIGLGEDGPTHQPVEHAAMLRLTPNMEVWRPADLVETAVAWQQAISRHNGPCSLLLSRQTLLPLKYSEEAFDSIHRGGYIALEPKALPELILLATGSEVQIAINVATELNSKGKNIRVVSMPCCERFLAQEETYQEKVLPKKQKKRIAIEAASNNYWYRFVGLDGMVLGIDRFGLSAPGPEVYQYLNITEENLSNMITKILVGEVV